MSNFDRNKLQELMSRKHWQRSSGFARKMWWEEKEDIGYPEGMLSKWKYKFKQLEKRRSKDYYVHLDIKGGRFLRQKDKHGWCSHGRWF